MVCGLNANIVHQLIMYEEKCLNMQGIILRDKNLKLQLDLSGYLSWSLLPFVSNNLLLTETVSLNSGVEYIYYTKFQESSLQDIEAVKSMGSNGRIKKQEQRK